MIKKFLILISLIVISCLLVGCAENKIENLSVYQIRVYSNNVYWGYSVLAIDEMVDKTQEVVLMDKGEVSSSSIKNVIDIIIKQYNLNLIYDLLIDNNKITIILENSENLFIERDFMLPVGGLIY